MRRGDWGLGCWLGQPGVLRGLCATVFSCPLLPCPPLTATATSARALRSCGGGPGRPPRGRRPPGPAGRRGSRRAPCQTGGWGGAWCSTGLQGREGGQARQGTGWASVAEVPVRAIPGLPDLGRDLGRDPPGAGGPDPMLGGALGPPGTQAGLRLVPRACAAQHSRDPPP